MKRFLGGWLILVLCLDGAGQAKGDYVFTTIDVPGATLSQASGINNAGDIVGYSTYGGGFLLRGGTYNPLQIPTGAIPTAINSQGQIVGWYDGFPLTHFAGAWLLSGGQFATLKVPTSFPGAPQSQIGINDFGQIVGGYYPGAHPRAFLYSGGSYTDLAPPPGFSNSSAAGLNNQGQIVGDAQSIGCLLSGGTYTTFVPPGSPSTFPNAINNGGQITGDYVAGDGVYHGFLLSDGNLTTVDVPGSLSTWITGINDAGQFVGSYVDAAGARHGFLATPAPVPEPSTVILLGLGIVTLFGWAWRPKKKPVSRSEGT